MVPLRRLRVSRLLTLAAVLALGACSQATERAAAPTSTEGPARSASDARGDGEPVASAGCDDADAALATTTDGALTSGGVERTYALRVPAGDGLAAPMPVVVDLHGMAQTTAGREAQAKMGDLGEAEGFVTVVPQGLGDPPFLDVRPGGDDTVFVGELLDLLEAGLCIDTSRVYVTGYSAGAILAGVLACGDADRFAAAAPVAGVAPIADCHPARAVPVRAFQGSDDQMWRFDGDFPATREKMTSVFGDSVVDEVEPAMRDVLEEGVITAGGPDTVELMTAWAERNGCARSYDESSVTDHVRLYSWDGCPDDGATELYVIDGGGHTWPGSQSDLALEPILGPTTFEVDATEQIWDFFQQHSL